MSSEQRRLERPHCDCGLSRWESGRVTQLLPLLLLAGCGGEDPVTLAAVFFGSAFIYFIWTTVTGGRP